MLFRSTPHQYSVVSNLLSVYATWNLQNTGHRQQVTVRVTGEGL